MESFIIIVKNRPSLGQESKHLAGPTDHSQKDCKIVEDLLLYFNISLKKRNGEIVSKLSGVQALNIHNIFFHTMRLARDKLNALSHSLFLKIVKCSYQGMEVQNY